MSDENEKMTLGEKIKAGIGLVAFALVGYGLLSGQLTFKFLNLF